MVSEVQVHQRWIFVEIIILQILKVRIWQKAFWHIFNDLQFLKRPVGESTRQICSSFVEFRNKGWQRKLRKMKFNDLIFNHHGLRIKLVEAYLYLQFNIMDFFANFNWFRCVNIMVICQGHTGCIFLLFHPKND